MNLDIPANRKRLPTGFFITLGVSALSFLATKVNFSPFLGNYAVYYTIAFYFSSIYYLFYSIIHFWDYLHTLFNRHAELIITDEGIDDHLSIFSCGKLLWQDISGVRIGTLYSSEWLVVYVTEPGKYLLRSNLIKRYFLNKLIKTWQTPVVISSKRIKYDLKQLKDIILRQKENHGTSGQLPPDTNLQSFT